MKRFKVTLKSDGQSHFAYARDLETAYRAYSSEEYAITEDESSPVELRDVPRPAGSVRRERFEAWYMEEHGPGGYGMERTKLGSYLDPQLNMLWDAYVRGWEDSK